MFAFETEDVLPAWALPIENIIGVGGFVLALTANPLTSGVGRNSTEGFVLPLMVRAYMMNLAL